MCVKCKAQSKYSVIGGTCLKYQLEVCGTPTYNVGEKKGNVGSKETEIYI